MSLRYIFLIALVMFLSGCDSKTVQAPEPLTAEFSKPGVLEIHNAHGAGVVEVLDVSNLPVLKAQTFGRDTFEVRFDWRIGATYRIIPDIGEQVTIVAPASKPVLALRIHAPLGQNVHEYFIDAEHPEASIPPITVLADPNETVDILVEIEKLGDQRPVKATVSLSPENKSPRAPRMDTILENTAVFLQFEFDKQILQTRVQIGDTLPKEDAVLSVKGNGIAWDTRLVFAKKELSPNHLTLAKWDLPCDEQGTILPGRAPGQFALPNPVWQKLGALFNIQTKRISYIDPFAYEQFTFENHRDHALNLLIESAAVDPKNGEMIPYFSAPDFSSKGIVKPVMSYCQIPAKSQKRCVMPLFVSPDTQAGTYQRQIQIFPMGSDRVFHTLTSQVNVIRSHRLFSWWLVLTVVASLAWSIVVVVSYRRIILAFGVRVLTLLSLLGALKFCLGFGTEVLNQVLYSFLGPFNCLVGGLFSEVITYLLMTSVLFLVPRVGAMTIAGIVSYLIRGILFGSFGLTDILFTGSSIAFLELCLFLFGVTRLKHIPHRQLRIPFLMLALGIADAACTFTSLTLHSVFYRLFFADWYIALQVGITGFLYTLIGVYLGRSLGHSLRKVHL